MMSIRFTSGKLIALAAVAATLSVGITAVAQQPPGGGGGRRQGGGRGFGAPTLANTPAAVLADGLKLSATQKAKVQAIQDQYRKDMTALRPPQGQQPADPQEMRQKMTSLTEETTKSIEGVLTAEQNKQAPAFLKSVGGYRTVGIPLEVVPDLKLTSDQKSKIAAIADAAQKQIQDEIAKAQAVGGGQGGGGFQGIQELMKANRDKAAAVLTPSQKATLDKYNADHPQRGFGGGRRGGGGGAPGNGPV
jgi:Spy/CpxP family protein refolding chaperone